MTENRATSTPPLPILTRIEANLSDQVVLLLFLAPALLILGLAQGLPLVQSAQISLHDWTLSRSPVEGPYVGFENYARVLADSVFLGSIRFTLIFAVCSTILQLALGLGLALLTVGAGRGMKITRTLLLLPMVVAPVAVGTIWRVMLSARVGPVNKALAVMGIDGPNWLGNPTWATFSLILIDVWEWMPFVTIILAAALASLPADVIKAAEVDGASRFQVFRLIIWPMLLPVVILIAMFRFIDSLLTLDIIFTTTFGGPGFATHTLSFWIYQQGPRYFNISYAAAASWLLLVGCMLVALGFLILRKRAMHWQVAKPGAA